MIQFDLAYDPCELNFVKKIYGDVFRKKNTFGFATVQQNGIWISLKRSKKTDAQLRKMS